MGSLDYYSITAKAIFKNQPDKIFYRNFLILPFGNKPSEGLLKDISKEYGIFYFCDGYENFLKLYHKDNGMNFWLIR